MKIAHVIRYYPQSPYVNGLEVAIIQLDQSLKDLGYLSQMIAINEPNLLNILDEYDHVIVHFRRSSALKVLQWCQKKKKPVYLICHNGIGNIYYCIPNLFKKFLSLFSESYYLYKKVSGVIVFNPEDYRYLNIWFPKLKKTQCFLGIDQEKFILKNPAPFYKKLDLKGDEFLIIYPARIHPGKNLELLLKIWDDIAAPYSNAHLIFMGNYDTRDYKYYEYLKKQASNLTYKNRIYWIEDISYEDEMLVCAYSAASIVVFPSLKESFGFVILEASVLGKPIITSPVGVSLSLIKDGVNGFICDPANLKSWKETLLTLLGDAELRKNIGEQSKKEVIEKYSWRESALKILDFIKDC